MKDFYILLLYLLLSLLKGKEPDLNENNTNESNYFTTWGTAILSTENPKVELSKNSIRQIIHISSSGNNIRLKLSNKMGKTNLEIKGITIADTLSQGTGEININTLTSFTFNKKNNATIPPEEEIYTDTINYPLKALSEVAISIYFGSTPERLSGHPNSRTFSFIEEGNKIFEKEFSKANKIDHWYFISSLEINLKTPKKTIVCFGDSITDGAGSDMDKQSRYPDWLSIKLNLNKNTSNIGVINKGINGNRITTQGIERYSYDVLDIKGVTYIMVLYGVNDINLLNATSDEVISAYKNIIKLAHKNNIFIFAGTILPYGNFFRWTEEREKYRKEINHWIRNTKPENGGFDYVFDYDKIIKDPNNETIIFSIYDSGDGIHPNSQGYQKMVQAIDNLEIFTKNPNFDEKSYEIILVDKIGIKFKLDFEIKKDDEIIVNIKGTCEGSKGFRVLTNNGEGKKTSDYYYTGILDKGEFVMEYQFKVNDDSNYIVIRRPISTINIDNITLEYIEVKSGEKKNIFRSLDEGIFLN